VKAALFYVSQPLVASSQSTALKAGDVAGGQEAAVASAEGGGQEPDMLKPVQYINLPEHNFKKGDPLLILKADKDGKLPPKVPPPCSFPQADTVCILHRCAEEHKMLEGCDSIVSDEHRLLETYDTVVPVV